MKKLISILLVMLMVLGCFAACANTETKDDAAVTTVGDGSGETTDAPETDTLETDAPETDVPDFIQESIELEGKKYKLSFFDDFDGEELDTTKWQLCPEQRRQDVGGYWDDSMISVADGNLVVSSAIREDGTPISGAIMTGNLFKQQKGYFEIRCKLHSAPGFWGAFWLMNEEQIYVNGNNDGTAIDGAEIDIFESCHVKQGKINQNIHYDGYGSGHVQVPHSETKSPTYDGEYHTFSFLWTDTAYVWYIDGEETYRLAEGSKKYPGCDEIPAFMIISSEFGTWAGKYDPATLPDQWYVDYVVVYAEDF